MKLLYRNTKSLQFQEINKAYICDFCRISNIVQKTHSCENNSAKSCKLSVKNTHLVDLHYPLSLHMMMNQKKQKSSWHMNFEFMDKFCNILKDNDIGISNIEQKNVLPLLDKICYTSKNSNSIT